MAVPPGPDDPHLLNAKILHAARYNEPQVIRDCLASLPPDMVKDILHCCSEYEGSQTTPLIIAAWSGNLQVVELLVNEFNVDVNQKVSCCFEMHHPLISAVCKGHKKIVNVLVRKGCDISAASRNGLTAVHEACRRNDLDVLKYLVDNGALIDESPAYLKLACWNENREMVEYLLSKGADPNEMDDEGRTVLHEAARKGASDIIKLLLHHGARFSKDRSGRSPLMEAAQGGSSEDMKVFLDCVELNALDRIEGWELLGATLARTNVSEAFMYLKQAMKERYKNPNAVLLKPHSPLPALTNVQESQTLEELHARQSDHHLLRLECLAILSRILGPGDLVTIHNFRKYADELQSKGSNDEATDIFLHGMKAAVKSHTLPCDTNFVLHLLWLKFVELLQHGMLTFFSDLEECMESALNVLENDKLLYFDSLANIKIWLQFILLALKVARGQEEGRRLQRLVKRFVHLTFGSIVLHAAVFFYWNKPDCLKDVDDLPYDLLVSFLLQCGAAVYVKNDSKNTPLHTIAWLSNIAPDCDLVSKIAKTLLDAGALVGVQNNEGKTPLDLAGPALAAELRELCPVSLKSLAATVVVNCNIPYIEEVPKTLAEFIEKH